MRQGLRTLLSGTARALLVISVLVVGGRSVLAEEFLPAALSPASSHSIRAIQQASDPSSAVQAFIDGVARNGKNVSLYEAYVSKMVALGLPGMAYSQAQYAVDAHSQFGLGWAVLAYGDSRQDRMTVALSEIVQASRYARSDSFVQATAGQLLAWYDSTPDKPAVDSTLQGDLVRMRADIMDMAAFKQAYQAAAKGYGIPAVEGAQPPVLPPQEPPPATPSQPAMDQTLQYGGTASPVYNPGYYSQGYYNMDYYPGVLPDYSWWQPTYWPAPWVLSFGHHRFCIGGDAFGRRDGDHHGHHGSPEPIAHSSWRGTLVPSGGGVVSTQGNLANRLTRRGETAAITGMPGAAVPRNQTFGMAGPQSAAAPSSGFIRFDRPSGSFPAVSPVAPRSYLPPGTGYSLGSSAMRSAPPARSFGGSMSQGYRGGGYGGGGYAGGGRGR